jgi:hypothetical protein
MASVDQLRALRTDLQAVIDRLDHLIFEASPRAGERSGLRELPRTRAIQAVLERSAGPMRPVEIWQALHEAGRGDPKMEVQVTTFDLWDRGRIGKVGRGLYVAKDKGA